MLDRTTTLQRYQTFIDGRWTDAVSGKTELEALIAYLQSLGKHAPKE